MEGNYADVVDNLKLAITGRGLNIAHVLPAGEMLNRTGGDLGLPDPVYKSAENLEFCSARLSHKLMAMSPDNLVVCPFTIGVYELKSDPGHVYIAYRVPLGMAGSEEALEEVRGLLQGVVDEAVW